MIRLVVIVSVSLMCMVGCASYSGAELKPGVATVADVEKTMSTPALSWKNGRGQVTVRLQVLNA